MQLQVRYPVNPPSSFIYSTRLQGSIMTEGMAVPLIESLPSVGWGRNLEFGQGAAIAQLHFVKDTVSLYCPPTKTYRWDWCFMTIRRTAHTLMNHSASETLGWHLKAGSGFKPRIGNVEASVRTSRPSCQLVNPTVGDISFYPSSDRYWAQTSFRMVIKILKVECLQHFGQ